MGIVSLVKASNPQQESFYYLNPTQVHELSSEANYECPLYLGRSKSNDFYIPKLTYVSDVSDVFGVSDVSDVFDVSGVFAGAHKTGYSPQISSSTVNLRIA